VLAQAIPFFICAFNDIKIVLDTTKSSGKRDESSGNGSFIVCVIQLFHAMLLLDAPDIQQLFGEHEVLGILFDYCLENPEKSIILNIVTAMIQHALQSELLLHSILRREVPTKVARACSSDPSHALLAFLKGTFFGFRLNNHETVEFNSTANFKPPADFPPYS
jgi:hypothetical protein